MCSKTNNLFADIPLAQAMRIAVSKRGKNELELCAPFECNRNDKGTAFVGSIASILTLAGWGLLTLQLRDWALEPDIMVVASEIKYICPAKKMLTATVEISDATLEHIRNELQDKQRSRVRLSITLHSDETECATATADYALIQRN